MKARRPGDGREGARRGPGVTAGLVVVGVAVCCGAPVVVAAGAGVTVLGLGLGSWFLIAAGVAAAVAGWLLWRQAHRGRSASTHATEEG